ncbi:ATP-dependent RNA helicase DeaD [Nautilia profundicola AmH]|uniref:ATP-dependent RNA helicase DeaD n=1 Tax=Nautilia profundicola (strain ATCC BAA-1463 / DSM 18972 / AmH) TaxID=598659 RepID=B9L6F6_NAUPA|nr:DEAD/DEAH box helicase [Nautilia profundicola]ACM92187.1 ATP-dependent RNA helicase DeaD [Nautilia profundicola AmH]
MTFNDFNLKKEILKRLEEIGFEKPSPIQEKAIPVVLQGKDIVAQAQTGTGKTAAFGLPILNMLEKGQKALIITPTRELAIQVSEEIFRFGKHLGIHTATVYGGSSYSRQINHIKNSEVIVATPGRLIDLLSSGKIDIAPEYVVLDEADEMLDMGFLDDIKEIFKYVPSNRQTLLFSATMPKPILSLAKTILKDPEFIQITKKEVTNENIKEYFYVIDEHERNDALIRLIDYKQPNKAIVFCRTKKDVDTVADFLSGVGFDAKGLHGDMDQRKREEVIKGFKGNRIEILVATDVAARGLDVNDVTHVFNYHLPLDPESYVHRIGRTGRAGKEGMAISLVTPHEFRALSKIQKISKIELKEVPTLQDVKNTEIQKIMEKISSIEPNTKSIEIVEVLQNDFDLFTIATKFASMLFEKDADGKERIGKSLKEAKRLLERSANSKGGNDRDRRRGRRGNFRGGRNSGRGRRR